MRRLSATVVLVGLLGSWAVLAQSSHLLNSPDSLKFAVLGDNGDGSRGQYELAEQMVASRRAFPYELVIMLGDNFYGSQRPADLIQKFDRPYAPLLQAGVVFQAAIGNHDEPHTLLYRPLNMNGERYYSFVRKNVRFFVLDTNQLDVKQVAWFETALKASTEDWKIAYFHHPLYCSAGRHGAAVDIRVLLEPLLVKYGVNAVFSGHDHIYERLKPQKGITYFVAGAGGRLRKGDLRPGPQTAASFDQDQSFMLVEVTGSELVFEAISRTGRSVDSGVIRRERQRELTLEAPPRTGGGGNQ